MIVSDNNVRPLITRRYDFHGLFRLAVHADDSRVVHEFQAEYGIFEDTSGQPADLDVTVHKFAVKPETQIGTFGKYSFAGDEIYGTERYKVATWQFAIRGLDEPTTHLFFHGGIFSVYFLQHFYVEPIIRYKLCRRGVVMVHGGCVANRGVSVLFPALGQVGKTALALQQTLAGWRFQSDDYTFLSATGMTFSYPRRLHLSDHIHDACPDVTTSMSHKHRLSIKAKKLVYYLTLKYGDLSESMTLHELIPSARIEPTARLGVVLSLNGAPGIEVRGPYGMEGNRLVDRIMAINALESKPFFNILLGQQYHHGTAALAEWWEQEQAILQKALPGIPAFEVTVPRDAPDRRVVLKGLARIMDDVLEEVADGVPA